MKQFTTRNQTLKGFVCRSNICITGPDNQNVFRGIEVPKVRSYTGLPSVVVVNFSLFSRFSNIPKRGFWKITNSLVAIPCCLHLVQFFHWNHSLMWTNMTGVFSSGSLWCWSKKWQWVVAVTSNFPRLKVESTLRMLKPWGDGHKCTKSTNE